MQRNPEAWVADRARDGYLVVQDCVDAKTLQCLRDRLEPILADPARPRQLCMALR